MTYPITKTGKWTIRAVNNNIMIESQLSNVIEAISVDKCAVKLKEVFPNPTEYGIFLKMGTRFSEFGNILKKLGGYYSLRVLDELYIYNHSGEKTISTLLENFIKRGWKGSSSTTLLTSDMYETLGYSILSKFGDKWDKLFDTLAIQYEVLNPYRMELDERISSAESNFRDLINGGKDTFTDSDNTTNTETFNDLTTVSENEQSAYNSSTYSPNTKDTDTTSGGKLTEFKRNNYGGTTYGKTQNETENKSSSNNRTFTRKGNIGNLTNQELIEKEREFLNYQVLNTIFEDMDSILTREYYH